MIAIFILSSQHANQSSQLSGGIVSKIIKIIYPGFSGFSPSKQLEIMDITSFVIRKIAHFSEYFILGVLTALAVDSFKEHVCKTHIPVAAVFCALYAVSDEIHQHFVPGRACRLLDVLIDTLGALVAILIFAFIRSRILAKKSGDKYAEKDVD